MPFPLAPQGGLARPSADERALRRRYMQGLVREVETLERALRLGGGPERMERQRAAGKMPARERAAALLDEGEELLEIGLLVAHDAHDGIAPGAGVVTGIGRVGGRPVAVHGERPNGQGGQLVSGDGHQDPAHPGGRDALPHTDRLPRGLRRRVPSHAARDLSGEVRRRANFPQLLPYAQDPEDPPSSPP